MIWETARLALRTLRANPFRTLLTMLSVTIGTFSIVVMLSLAQSGHKTLSSAVESIGGARLVIWIPSEGKEATTRQKAVYDKGFTDADVARLREVPHLARLAPQASYGRENLWVTSDAPTQADVVGVELGLFDILDWHVEHGRGVERQDLESLRRVAVITGPLADELFGERATAVGRTMTIGRKPYTVVGVLETRNLFGLSFGFSWDSTAFIPMSTAEKREGRPEQARFLVGLTDDPKSNASVEAVGNAALLTLHRNVEDFSSLNFGSFLQQFYTFFMALDAVVVAIAGISLFAGGIGVMNIMLVSVTERVREIGIRKAVGASRPTIMFQFVIESTTLSLTGGVLGVVTGLLVTSLAHVAIGMAVETWVPVWSVNGVAVALGSTAFIGLMFGSIPAWRASRLDIVECLRR
ncbi:MAG: ABC transporter permease [Alphaproteobacteria bacterium]|nr:ABC transporter permease [Alphaproteobacteria bacterium]